MVVKRGAESEHVQVTYNGQWVTFLRLHSAFMVLSYDAAMVSTSALSLS